MLVRITERTKKKTKSVNKNKTISDDGKNIPNYNLFIYIKDYAMQKDSIQSLYS